MSKTFDALKKLHENGLFAASGAKPADSHGASPAATTAEVRDVEHAPPAPLEKSDRAAEGPSRFAERDQADAAADNSTTVPVECDQLPSEPQANESTPEQTSNDDSLDFDLLINNAPVVTPELAEQLSELAAMADLPQETLDDQGLRDRSLDRNHARPSAPHYEAGVRELIPDEAWQELEALAAAKSLEAEFQAAQLERAIDIESDPLPPTADDSRDMTILLDDVPLPSDFLGEIPPARPSSVVDHYDPVIPLVDDLVEDLADDELATLPLVPGERGDGDEKATACADDPPTAPARERPAESGAETAEPVNETGSGAVACAERRQSEPDDTTVDWVPVTPQPERHKAPTDDPSLTNATRVLDAHGHVAAEPLSAENARSLSDHNADRSGDSRLASAATPVGPHPVTNGPTLERPPLAGQLTVDDTKAHSTGEIMNNSLLQQRISQLRSLPGGSSAAVRQCVQRIEEQFDQRLPHLLLMTSAIETTRTADVLLLLAHELRDTGRKVLLVDANLSQQPMTRTLEALGEPGLCDVLAGCSEASEVVRPTGVEGIAFVPCGDDVIGVSRDMDLVPESVWVHAIHRWGADFGCLLIDGGSTESTLLPTLARNCQAAVLLVPYATRDASHLRSTARNLNALAPITVGCVLTDFPLTPV